MSTQYVYWDAISPLLPAALRDTIKSETKPAIEAVIRLVVGAGPSVGYSDVEGWPELRSRAGEIVEQLKRGEYDHASSSHKRPRDDDESAPSKKARTDDASDAPLFTLHALSVTSPVRKKVDVSVHASSIRLTNPISRELEHPPIPISAIQRVFLIPTRGKSKPHWTALLLPSDIPAAAPPKGTTSENAPQITFGLDATLAATLTTTSYDADASPSSATHPKGSQSLAALRTFLSHLSLPTFEPSTATFRSAANREVAGVEAYRRAKAGTLWFLDAGVLWDGKPCEFFPLEQLTRGEPYEGVRTLSATGRTCSVILRRVGGGEVNGKGKGKAADEDEEGDDAEEEGVDMDFDMVDGKEQEPIGRWVKAHRSRFGRQKTTVAAAAPDAAAPRNGQPVEEAAQAADEDEDDEDDENFTVDSSELGSESSSDSEDSDGSGASGTEEDASDDGSDDGAEDEDEGELKQENHPLLRPGAMPKRISRAAMDMVVDMVEQDLVGGRKVESEEGEDELDD